MLLLPRSWTSPLFNVIQVLIPLQTAVDATADLAASAVQRDDGRVPIETLTMVERHRDALEHERVALAARVAELEQTVRALSATREFDAGGGSLGLRGQLIPARVLADDALPWRSSALLLAGSAQGVAHGQAVVSRYFTVDRGTDDGMRDGLAILLGEVVVGWIDQVGASSSRVKLVSDVTVEAKVRIGRLTVNGPELLDGYFWLNGRGRERMEIRDVDRRLVEGASPQVQPGDVVLSDPLSDKLPTSLVVGQVESIEPDRHNPLLAILAVRGAINGSSLDRVYIYDPAMP